MSELLFSVLKESADAPVLGELVEELLWASWSVHENEQVASRTTVDTLSCIVIHTGVRYNETVPRLIHHFRGPVPPCVYSSHETRSDG